MLQFFRNDVRSVMTTSSVLISRYKFLWRSFQSLIKIHSKRRTVNGKQQTLNREQQTENPKRDAIAQQRGKPDFYHTPARCST